LSKNPGVILLTAAQSAADGVESKQLRGLNGARKKMLVFKRVTPISAMMCDSRRFDWVGRANIVISSFCRCEF